MPAMTSLLFRRSAPFSRWIVGLLAVFSLLTSCGGRSAVAAAPNADLWADAAKYLVLEPKPEVWKAQWIDAGPGIAANDFGKVFYVRKTFKTQDPDAFRRVYVSADSRYKLWVNGVPAARGPARFDPVHQQYDTLNLSSLLKKGENVIAAEILYWGVGEPSQGGPIFQMSARPAFVLESAELKTDKSWKTLICQGQEAPAWENVFKNWSYYAGNWLEKVDARKLPVDWQMRRFDDSQWAAAHPITRAEIWGEGDTRAPWKLLPRTIRALEEQPPVAAQAIQSGVVVDAKAMPPFSFAVKADEGAPKLPVTIPGDGKIHYVVFDAGKLVTAYPQLELEGAAGAVVEIMYAEAPSPKTKTTRRNALDGKRIEGYNDIYITRDGLQTYEPFFHRAFWYVRVAVKSSKPLTIRGLKYRWTSYGFPERGSFECSDPLLNKIWQTGWYTARLCAHETYEDCPYYEQLQYVGDTRIQAMVTFYASGDNRLPAAAIRQIGASRLPEGLTYARYPSHLYQVIPGFSLFWVMMVDDYYLYTGDLDLVRENAGGVYSVLRFFEKYETKEGFIAGVPYWNYHDATFPDGGAPAGSKTNCTLTTLLYKGALDAGARIFTALGDKHEAARFHERSVKVAEAVNRLAWSEKEGLYTDGIGIDGLSKHANTYAVLFGVADAERQKRIAKRLFTDPAVRDTTFYFAHYLHQAAVRLGQTQRVIDDLDRWKAMLDTGTSTWWETPENTRSECHAWSAAPTFELMQEVLGVRPTKPGFERVKIEPFPAKLQWAKGTVPTPRGDIQVSWKREPVFELRVTLPKRVEAEVILPDGTKATLGAGKHTLRGRDPR